MPRKTIPSETVKFSKGSKTSCADLHSQAARWPSPNTASGHLVYIPTYRPEMGHSPRARPTQVRHILKAFCSMIGFSEGQRFPGSAV